MQKIKVKLKGASYDILIGQNILSKSVLPKSYRYIVITDSDVKKVYGVSLVKKLKKSGLRVDLISFPAGEKSKNQKTKSKVEQQMLKLGCSRDTTIIALGGGVVGDLAGFIAATYMRGLDYIQIPTTLLAMVDSSVGGKTGIDAPQGKNIIGAFWQPKKVIIDQNFLVSLPHDQLVNGLVEAIKMYITHNKSMFVFTEKNLDKIIRKDKKVLQKIIFEAIKIKTGVVMRDERETNERMVLNFGHTIGHAIELLSKFKMLHGQAVALGILVEAKISQVQKNLPLKSYQIIENLITDLGVNKKILKKYKATKIIKGLQADKKNRLGKPKFVILSDLGKIKVSQGKYAHEVGKSIINKALKQV